MDWNQALLAAFIGFSGFVAAHAPTIGNLAYQIVVRWMDAKWPPKPPVAPTGAA